MSTLDKSEIIFEYSNLIGPPITKKAWTWRDLAQELGWVAVGEAVGTAVFGLGALTTPLGWVALAAGAAYAIYEATSIMDDRLDDLLDRLGALNPHPMDEQRVNGWMETIKYFKPLITAPPTGTDEQKDAALTLQRQKSVNDLVLYLEKMQAEWPLVRQRLSDRWLDPGQAEHSIKSVLATMKNLQTEINRIVNTKPRNK